MGVRVLWPQNPIDCHSLCTGHMWTERRLGDSAHPTFMQKVHYENVAKTHYQWPDDVKELVNNDDTFYPDCSKPPDRTGCLLPLLL